MLVHILMVVLVRKSRSFQSQSNSWFLRYITFHLIKLMQCQCFCLCQILLDQHFLVLA